MAYRVVFPGHIRERLVKLRDRVRGAGQGRQLGETLALIHQCLVDEPLGFGEIQYTVKNLGLAVCLLARNYLAVAYVVDTQNQTVSVTKLRMLSDHPFPRGFEAFLND